MSANGDIGEDNAVPDVEFRHARPKLHDLSGSLMS
jgi:hypothetical protein